MEPSNPEPKAASRPATIAHLPALDGLRGAAVLGVLFFHDDRLRGGYLGVDLFFVLSGFLITSLLVAEHRAAGRIDLKAFWIRRARRLFPAVLALLPAVGLYAAIFTKPAEMARVRGDGIATLLYFANWRAIFAGKSYWDLFAAPSPLEHTWSLAIEEQFYVLWPLISFFVLSFAGSSRGRGGRVERALLTTSVALAIASGAAMWLLYSADRTQRAYMGTDTRGASILAGAALACVIAGRGAATRKAVVRGLDVLGALAIAGLGVAWARMDGQGEFLYRGGFWLCEIAALVLIACASIGANGLVAKVFSIAPLRWAGLASYGIYLWHWPIYVLLSKQRAGFGGWGLTALRLGLTIAVSLVSYRLLEQPIRKRGIWFGPPILIVPAATLAVFAMFMSLTTTLGASSGDASEARPGLLFSGPPKLYNADITAMPAPGAAPEGTLRVLVLGDSVAVALGDRLRFVQESGKAKVAVRALGDCNALDEQHVTKSLNGRRHDGGDCDAKWASDVAELRPDVSLVVLGGGFFAPVEIGGKWRVACDPEWHDAYVAELGRQMKILGDGSGRVLLARAPYPVDHWASERWDRATDCFNGVLDEVAAAAGPRVKVLDLKGKLCPGKDHESCELTSQGASIRPDGMHFEGLGGEEIARWALGQMR